MRVLLLVGVMLASPLMAQVFDESDLIVARDLREAALAGNGGFDIVEDLTTRVGPRLAGSEGDARAVDWAEAMLTELGFDRVWREPATFPTWSRGHEEVAVVSPVAQDFEALALGYSPATPEEGIEAEVVMFDDLAALEAAGADTLNGKIVFIRNRMERARDGSGYGPAVQARARGAMVAAEKGAEAVLIRSIGTSTNRFAHTGGMRFDTAVRSLPAAAISNPDADQLERLIRLGEPVVVRMNIDAQINEAYTSNNVIGQINGARYPEQVVALGAHLDSWDVGTGALDDGSGVGIVTEAARRIMALEQRPDRSVQVILFAAEEIGLWGGRAWAQERSESIDQVHVAAESDFGAGPIYAMSARVVESARPVIEAIAAELEPLGIELTDSRRASGGPDFIPAFPLGLAAVDLYQDGTHYFDYHHTENDTLDKIDPEALKQNAAAYAVLAWLAAQSPVRFGSGAALLEQERED
ncbi:MAG: M20/M25/M40 family metallo-hydrolase [Pseudomonadota bacterium]